VIKRVRILNQGGYHTQVIDMESGEIISGVSRIEIEQEPGAMMMAKITLLRQVDAIDVQAFERSAP
jgi:hypothetical protein